MSFRRFVDNRIYANVSFGGCGADEVFAPSTALERLACGWYGFGHTNHREPGDTRGTPIGKKGRFRSTSRERRCCLTLEL